MHIIHAGINPENKYQLFTDLGRDLANRQIAISCVFLIMEYWLSTNPDASPIEDPQRQEVVIISGLTLDQRENMATISIRRDAKNRMQINNTILFPYQVENSEVKMSANQLLVSFLRGYALTLYKNFKSKEN